MKIEEHHSVFNNCLLNNEIHPIIDFSGKIEEFMLQLRPRSWNQCWPPPADTSNWSTWQWSLSPLTSGVIASPLPFLWLGNELAPPSIFGMFYNLLHSFKTFRIQIGISLLEWQNTYISAQGGCLGTLHPFDISFCDGGRYRSLLNHIPRRGKQRVEFFLNPPSLLDLKNWW